MNKVLTLRTRNLLINSTQFSYIVVIKNPENKLADKKYTIRPGESVSFPKELENCKISLKTIDDREFSNYIPAKKLIFKTAVGHTVSLLKLIKYRITFAQEEPSPWSERS